MRKLLLILLITCACLSMQAQVNIIQTIAGRDSPAYCCDGGPAVNAELNYPNQLCLDRFGNVYIADAVNNRIRKIVLSTGIITTVAGIDTFGYSGDGGQATDAMLNLPDGVCADTFGNIYISDVFNSRIRKITQSTGIIATIAGTGLTGNSGDGHQATDAEINGPQGITIDKFGNLYFADIFNQNVRKISAAGIISTIAGNGTGGYSGDGGSATDAQLARPGDVGIDTAGNIIITDNENHVVRKVDVVTNVITTIAGNGISGYSGNGGLAINCSMSFPYGLFIDKMNNIFIVEGGTGVIRKIDAVTGIISLIAGTGTVGFSGDGGPATAAQLRPDDIFIDSLGVMYIADFSNQRIRIVYNDKLETPAVKSEDNAYSISPNPNDGNFVVQQVIADNEPVKAKIYDAVGRILYTKQIQFANANSRINMVNYVPGLYVLEITDSQSRVFRFKFVIDK